MIQTLNKGKLSVLISDKVDFRTRNSFRNKEGHFVIVIGSVHQENITTLFRIVCF